MWSRSCLFVCVLTAIAVVGAAAAPWQAGTYYAVGDVVTYDGVTYKCLQAHTTQNGWEPSMTPALWLYTDPTPAPSTTAPSGSCWSLWGVSELYLGGSQASYNGINYRAAWWTQGDAPADNTGVGKPWVVIAPCTGTPVAPSTAAPTSAPTSAAATSAPTSATTQAPSIATSTPSGSGCGYDGQGVSLNVASGISVCVPPHVCTSETCPPSLGKCVNNECVFQNGYKGLQTLTEGWSTYYCTLSTGGCHGVSQVNFPEVTADLISAGLSRPLCEGYTGNGTCIGIAASPPMMVGNSQEAVDPSTGKLVSNWGLGMTEASGLCYSVTGPGGTAIVALTDRCGGYCKCGGSGYQECGPCVSAADMEPNCACVGPVPGLHDSCCGNTCGVPVVQECDWCASNNHPHFDFDTGTFHHVCGSAGIMGSCQLSKITPVACLTPNAAWPPGGARCPDNQFDCGGVPPSADQPVVPGTTCCCPWGMKPQADSSCK